MNTRKEGGRIRELLSPSPSSNFTWHFFVSSAFFVDTSYFFFPFHPRPFLSPSFPFFAASLSRFKLPSVWVNASICDPWTITEGWKISPTYAVEAPSRRAKFTFQTLFYQCRIFGDTRPKFNYPRREKDIGRLKYLNILSRRIKKNFKYSRWLEYKVGNRRRNKGWITRGVGQKPMRHRLLRNGLLEMILPIASKRISSRIQSSRIKPTGVDDACLTQLLRFWVALWLTAMFAP